ncbi:MAG: hypothetical protein GYA52_05095 [Chloroflexi bacterium]|nr:hypothetical protein [Chloroflexota bacterium]
MKIALGEMHVVGWVPIQPTYSNIQEMVVPTHPADCHFNGAKRRRDLSISLSINRQVTLFLVG